MKIAVVSDLATGGGAAIAGGRLARGMARQGAEVVRFVVEGEDPELPTRAVGNPTLASRLIHAAGRRIVGRQQTDRARASGHAKKILADVSAFRPDLVHIHNLHGRKLDFQLLVDIHALGAPVVWTLHDMWAFTGGCVYAYDCDRFTSGACDADCPVADEYPFPGRQGIATSLALRQRFFDGPGRDVVIVTPSRWLAAQAGLGVLAGNRIEVIANGVDLTRFQPLGQAQAKRALGLPDDRPIMLTGAQDIRERRKGWRFLAEALEKVAERHTFTLVTYGCSDEQVAPFDIINLGSIDDEARIVQAYCAADLFLLPTLADNLPNVLVEALACGVPSVAFDVGGVSDVVRAGQTGFLARQQDAAHLADQIDRALVNGGLTQMGERCRQVAESDYDVNRQARCYLDLFGELCG